MNYTRCTDSRIELEDGTFCTLITRIDWIEYNGTSCKPPHDIYLEQNVTRQIKVYSQRFPIDKRETGMLDIFARQGHVFKRLKD